MGTSSPKEASSQKGASSQKEGGVVAEVLHFTLLYGNSVSVYSCMEGERERGPEGLLDMSSKQKKRGACDWEG